MIRVWSTIWDHVGIWEPCHFWNHTNLGGLCCSWRCPGSGYCLGSCLWLCPSSGWSLGWHSWLLLTPRALQILRVWSATWDYVGAWRPCCCWGHTDPYWSWWLVWLPLPWWHFALAVVKVCGPTTAGVWENICGPCYHRGHWNCDVLSQSCHLLAIG